MITLIENWQSSWKFISMQASALGTSLGIVQVSIGPGSAAHYVAIAVLVCNVAAMYGRLIQQKPDQIPPPAAPPQ